jgi:hypothetical protein
MIRRPVFLLVVLAMMFCFSNQASAILPGEAAAGLAATNVATKAVPQVLRALGQTLNVPLGLVETALSPLPGPTIAGGITRTAKGLMGPVNLLSSCLKAPVSLLKSVAGALNPAR